MASAMINAFGVGGDYLTEVIELLLLDCHFQVRKGAEVEEISALGTNFTYLDV